MGARGRRRGDSGTRDAIRAAAGRQFAERGYHRTTLRSVAAEAGVDTALVVYFFASKERLFGDVVAFPFDPAEAVRQALRGDRERVGERFARLVVTIFDDPGSRQRLSALVRAAASEPAAADPVRRLVKRKLIAAVAGAHAVDDADLRATLVVSQVVGLVMARYVFAVEPLASLPDGTLIAVIAPNLQRCLAEPLDLVSRAARHQAVDPMPLRDVSGAVPYSLLYNCMLVKR